MAWQSDAINPATTSPASDISKITNDLAQLRGVIGGTPDAAIPSAWATPTSVLAQSANSGTTAGTSTAYTLAPSQTIAAYAAGQSFWVKFHTASGASPTLQISSVASPPTLVRQTPDGAYANIKAGDIPTNHRSRVTLISTTQALVETMPPTIVLLETKIASSSASIDFTGIDGSFESYEIEFDSVKPATDDVYLGLRFGTGGTPTWETSGYAYNGRHNATDFTATGADRIPIGNPASTWGTGSGTNKKIEGRIVLRAPGESDYPIVTFHGANIFPSVVNAGNILGSGLWATAGAVTGVRLLFSSGNIASGNFHLYGRRKS